jgi:hypothetical protein
VKYPESAMTMNGDMGEEYMRGVRRMMRTSMTMKMKMEMRGWGMMWKHRAIDTASDQKD